MKIAFNFLTALWVLMISCYGESRTLSVGFFRETFMKDPTEYGFYGEHVAIAQVLETLITTNSDGDLAPSIAERWEVLNSGKKYRFHLRPDAKFSTAQEITAADVKYSIGRHLNNPKSQSRPFLADIDSVEVIDKHIVEINLKNPRVAIFKVLSRDQLGIVPNGWKFDGNAAEPFIASGPYRAVKKNKKIYFIPPYS